MPTSDTQHLRRVLGTGDLIFFNIAAVVGVRWLAAAAHSGPGSITLWILAAVFFFVPCATVIAALTARYPNEGGIYVWTRDTFGSWHGFFCAWCYWTTNLFYFPSLAVAGAGMALTIFGPQYSALADNQLYVIPASLAAIWIITFANIAGLDIGKWVGNAGGACTYLVGLILIACGIIGWWRFGSATPLDLAPRLDWEKVNFWPQIAFAFGGLELAPVVNGEVRDPVNSIRRAAWFSGLLIAFFYIAGTLSLLVLLSPSEVSTVTGLTQAGEAAGKRLLIPGLAPLFAILVTFGVTGQLGAWVSGTSRLPLVLGADRYLPAFFSDLHPRFRTPHKALLLQASACSIFLLAMQLGENLRAGYQLLVDLTVILYFIPFLYMFAAAWRIGVRAAALSGVTVTTLAILFSLVPPSGVHSIWLFEAKLIGGTALLVLAAFLWYRYRTRLSK